jgi:hypothetical protein
MDESINEQTVANATSLKQSIQTPETPSQPPQPLPPVKNYKIPFIISLLVLITLLASGGFFLYQNKLKSAQDKDVSISLATSTPAVEDNSSNDTPEITPTPETIEGQKRYTSQKLKVSFLYMEKIGGETFQVKEVGNKIYIYDSRTPFEQGQSAEVFEKSATQTLEEAITQIILKEYSTESCLVKSPGFMSSNTVYPTSYSTASIIPNANSTDFETVSNFIEKNCPTKYTSFNGMMYFIADSKHPDKFVFFSIGQYAILANTDQKNPITWQDTLEFLD